MTNAYLLTYNAKPLGIYTEMFFIFDFILEMINMPNNNFNICGCKIYEYEHNRGYPLNTFKFIFKEEKLLFIEESEKRVEMSKTTFNRFIKIKSRTKPVKLFEKVFDKSIEQKTNTQDKQETQLTAVPESTSSIKSTVILTKEDVEDIEKEKEKIRGEIKNTIAELNKMKYRNKKIKNWYNKYKTDIMLYEKFSKEKQNNESFVIPKLFEDSYNLFEEKGTQCFTDYFTKFNEESDLDIAELDEFMESYESDSDNSSISD